MSSNSLLTEAFRKVLAQPVPPSAEEQAIEDLFIKPRSVTAKDIANIPNLQSKGDVCRLMNDMEDNIQLIEYRTRAEEKAEKLEYLRKANMAPRCRHVRTDGDTCGCPALRDAQYCRFHAEAQASELNIPLIEDRESLQLAYMNLARQVVSNKLDARQASVLLQIFEGASRNLDACNPDEP